MGIYCKKSIVASFENAYRLLRTVHGYRLFSKLCNVFSRLYKDKQVALVYLALGAGI